MSARARSTAAFAVVCVLLPVAVASSDETFRVVPGGAPYTTTTEWLSDGMYAVNVGGTIVETDRYGNESVFSAYHCLSGVACGADTDGVQTFMVRNELGADLSFPVSGPTPALDGLSNYDFVTKGHADDRLTFSPIPYRRGHSLEPVSYSGDGFTFTVKELPVAYRATFGFIVDGFPDIPRDDDALPEDLVGVEVKSSKKASLTTKPITGKPPDEIGASATGVVQLVTSYIYRTTEIDERKIRLVIDEQGAGYGNRDGRRAVTVMAEVEKSEDRSCQRGTRVQLSLVGGKGRGAYLVINQAGDDGRRRCLSKRSVGWERRDKFKVAKIGFLTPVPE